MVSVITHDYSGVLWREISDGTHSVKFSASETVMSIICDDNELFISPSLCADWITKAWFHRQPWADVATRPGMRSKYTGSATDEAATIECAREATDITTIERLDIPASLMDQLAIDIHCILAREPWSPYSHDALAALRDVADADDSLTTTLARPRVA